MKKYIIWILIIAILVLVAIGSIYLLTQPKTSLPPGYMELTGTISSGKGGCYLISEDSRLKAPNGIPEYISVFLGNKVLNEDCFDRNSTIIGKQVQVKGEISCSSGCPDGSCQMVGPFCSIKNSEITYL